MTHQYDVGFPTSPCTDPATGEVTPMWRRFLQVLWQRTGETTAPAIGVSSDAINQLGRKTPTVVIPTGSPFRYTPSTRGTLFVAGGGVEALTITRGTTTAAVGGFYGGMPMSSSDTATITYLTAPQLVFFAS
jgi:hypothetical protein